MYKLMHTPYRIGNIEIPNRIVKSAMFEYCANQGKITEDHCRIYEEAARGGCGLIITGMEAISLGRPLVREPDLPNKWKVSNQKASCISCNHCFQCKDIISCQCV